MNNTVWFDSPAKYWTDAIPMGNGFLGGMFFCSDKTDRIALNHDTLWTGCPRYVEKDRAYEAYKKAQSLALKNDFISAQKELTENFLACWTQAYLPLGDLLTAVAGVKVYGTELKMDEENKVDIKNLVKSLKANGESLEPDGDGVVDLGNLNTVTQNVLTVTGTAGSASGHRIRFASGDDSNIKVTVSNEGDEIVVKFDVYYK